MSDEPKKLWHDDIRRPPSDDWLWARTNEQAREILSTYDITEASLDHDLGCHELDPDAPDAWLYRGQSEDNGFELVKWMCETGHLPKTIVIHSWNPDGSRRMADALWDAGACPILSPFRVDEGNGNA